MQPLLKSIYVPYMSRIWSATVSRMHAAVPTGFTLLTGIIRFMLLSVTFKTSYNQQNTLVRVKNAIQTITTTKKNTKLKDDNYSKNWLMFMDLTEQLHYIRIRTVKFWKAVKQLEFWWIVEGLSIWLLKKNSCYFLACFDPLNGGKTWANLELFSMFYECISYSSTPKTHRSWILKISLLKYKIPY